MSIPKKIWSRKDEITADFMALLDEHMKEVLAGRVEKMYHIKDFAARLFIHPTHFSNTIKHTTGFSPCHFAEERTMVEAYKMLREEELSIAQISYRLTFNEPTNFTKFFKSFAGITPRQYRQNLKNGN